MSGRNHANAIRQLVAIDGDDLRNIDYGVPGEARDATGEEHVSRSVNQSEVRSDDGGDGGCDPGRVKAIRLQNHEGTPVPWGRSGGFAEISPTRCLPA